MSLSMFKSNKYSKMVDASAKFQNAFFSDLLREYIFTPLENYTPLDNYRINSIKLQAIFLFKPCNPEK